MSDFDASAASAFFQRLLIPAGQYLEIRSINPNTGSVQQRFCRTTSEAVAAASSFCGRANVYVGTCPRSRRIGSRDAVSTVFGAWADIDFHQLDANREVAFELAYRRIEDFGRQPSVLVHSGNGLQAWWLFHRPAPISPEWPGERFEAINSGIAGQVGGDHVHDLPRVLRVPGTVNLPDARKRGRGCKAVLARLLTSDGPTHSPSDFNSIAASVPVSPKQQNQALERPAQPRDEVVEAFQTLLADLGTAHPLTRTWNGDRIPKDTSHSGWDWALTRELYRVGVKDVFIPDIIRAYSKGRGPLATETYISRTMHKARQIYRGSHGSEQPVGA